MRKKFTINIPQQLKKQLQEIALDEEEDVREMVVNILEDFVKNKK
jgi:predicted transcriptional regulator